MRIQLSAISHQPAAKSRGFTLIETIMVMVIIAILAVVVVVRNPFDAIKLRSAARKVAGDIRYVQKLAISNQTRAGMAFNANGYSVYRDMTVAAPYPAAVSPGDPCSTDPLNNFIVDFNDPRCSNYSGVTIAPPFITIAFNSLGSPVNAAGVAIGPETVTVTYNGSQTITIAAGTGRVSIP
ncbi:MAG: prepilin-type N-terminal cleavage/methylation domain-containing protein [Nitrospirae bacterium]|nr:MAG: prepilin-type N-terminal cleavage/methylation domain-containing protein [Nitrospirota bacterium]